MSNFSFKGDTLYRLIPSVSIYSFRTLLRTLSYNFDMYLFFSLKETGLENLEQSLYLCILWFWILNVYGIQLSIIHVSKYWLMPVIFLFICFDFTRWGIDEERNIWGILYFVTPVFLSIGCDFTRWGIDLKRNRVSPGYASSGWNLFVTPALSTIERLGLVELSGDDIISDFDQAEFKISSSTEPTTNNLLLESNRRYYSPFMRIGLQNQTSTERQ